MKIKKGSQKKISAEELLLSLGNICFDFVGWHDGWLRYEFETDSNIYIIRVETPSKVGCLADSKRYLNSFSKDTVIVVKDSNKVSELEKNLSIAAFLIALLSLIVFFAWVTVTYLTLLSFGILMSIAIWFSIKAFNENSISIIYTGPIILVFLIACTFFKYGTSINIHNLLSLFIK